MVFFAADSVKTVNRLFKSGAHVTFGHGLIEVISLNDINAQLIKDF